MILIYSDSQIIDFEWIPKIKFKHEYQTTHSINEYLQATADIKIAFVGYKIYCNYDTVLQEEFKFEDRIQLLSANSDYVFTWDSEIHPNFWETWNQCNRDNVYWLMPGTVNDVFRKQVVPWQDWFKNCADLYRQLPDKLNQLQPHREKQKYFDALLGIKKPHRDFVYKNVLDNSLQDQFIMPYGGIFNNRDFYAQDYFLFEPETEIKEPEPGTAGAVSYCGIHTSLSKVIHLDTYNTTAYSIIAETNYDNSFSFFTEKTAKPLIGKRLFVVFSGCQFLSNLRQLGFRTFDTIIDESYDAIENNLQRWNMAFEQVKYLCQLPQKQILEQIKPIVDHNFEVIMHTNWTEYSVDYMSKIVD